MLDLPISRPTRIGLTAVAICAVLVWVIIRVLKSGSRKPGMPPGPPTVPILGNIPIFPKSSSYLQHAKWAREYGEIFSLVAGPTGLTVILTSPEAVYELMEKQGAFSADRPTRVVVDILTGGLLTGLSRCNAYWKASRRCAHEVLSAAGCAKILPIQIAEANQIMFDVLQTPADTYYHIQRYGISFMMSVMSGQRVPQQRSPTIAMLFYIYDRISLLLEPGFAPPLEMFPILKYVPERWAPWKTYLREIRSDQRKFYFGLLKDSEDREARGQANGCHFETVRRMAPALGMTREQVCYFGHSMMNAGSTTTTSFLQFFVLLITAHPEVQVKAQEEIDRVIGRDQAPRLHDIDSLPYVQAIIKEVHRFRPIAPMGLPHKTTADLSYKNYVIPAGSVLFANVWGIFRQESLFENADAFIPERFIKSPLGLREGVGREKDEAYQCLLTLPFGTGRRACPGVHLAHQSISINVMNLLWAFNFAKARAPDGTVIEPDLWAFTKGATSDPTPFVVGAQVRDPAQAAIIRRNFVESSEVFELFERELTQEERDYVSRTRGQDLLDI